MNDDPLLSAILKAIRNYRMTNMTGEDGEAYPLLDLMSRPGKTVADGEEQMGELAFAVREAVLNVRENA